MWQRKNDTKQKLWQWKRAVKDGGWQGNVSDCLVAENQKTSLKCDEKKVIDIYISINNRQILLKYYNWLKTSIEGDRGKSEEGDKC